MQKVLMTGFFLLLLSSCCTEEPVETARFELSAHEQALLPYQVGEKIGFVHSNGFSFDFTVTDSRLEWKKYVNFCEWNCCGNDYFSYQVKTAVLESAYPNLHIELSLGGTRFSEYESNVLTIEINYRQLVQFPYDSLVVFRCDSLTKTEYYDSVLLNNRMYYDVVSKEPESHFLSPDSSAFMLKSVYFNKLGLIQLEMSTNETFTISR